MHFDYTKRDYLLPKGCKDLIDVLNLEKQQKRHMPLQPWKLPPITDDILVFEKTSVPPITGEILVSEKTSVRELAALLDQKPFKVVADLMELGVFASVNGELDFDTVSRVV